MRYSRYTNFRPFQFLVQPFLVISALTVLFIIAQLVGKWWYRL